MKKSFLKDYAPIIFVILCAAAVGTLMITGKVNIRDIPDYVQDRYALAIVIIMAFFVIKGFSGVVLYDVLVLVVGMIFPIWQTLLINSIGTFITLAISYYIGYFTKTERIEDRLDRHPKIKKYFTATQKYGFVFCFAVHSLGLNMEVLGIIFGMLKIGTVRYLISSYLGLLPGMVWLSVMGNTWNFRSPVFWSVVGINICFFVFSIFYTRRKLRNEE